MASLRNPSKFTTTRNSKNNSNNHHPHHNSKDRRKKNSWSSSGAEMLLPPPAASNADAAEIEYLEEMLGINKKKRKTSGSSQPKASSTTKSSLMKELAEDGLDELMELIDNIENNNLVAEGVEAEVEEAEEAEEQEQEHEKEELPHKSNQEALIRAWEDEYKDKRRDELYGFNLAAPKLSEAEKNHQDSTAAHKYVPPHLRANNNDLLQINNKIQSILNKLSYGNIEVISQEISNLYKNPNYSKVSINESLQLAMIEICSSSIATNAFSFGSAALVSCINQSNLSAPLVEKICLRLKNSFSQPNNHSSQNLFRLLCALYRFNVISENLIYSTANYLLNSLTSSSEDSLLVELLLILFETIGYKLRHADSLALKQLILLTHTNIKAFSQVSSVLDKRIQYLNAAINDIKNNKKKCGNEINELLQPVHSWLDSKKLNNAADSRLQMSWEDIENIPSQGRYWLVGAKYTGKTTPNNKANKKDSEQHNEITQLAASSGFSSKLHESVYSIIVHSVDYLDSYEKLTKFSNANHGKSNQIELQVSRVLLDCCGREKLYNPYYSALVNHILTHDRQYRFSIKLALWDFFKAIQHNTNSIPINRQAVNLAQLFASLLLSNTGLSLLILKELDLFNLSLPAVLFTHKLFKLIFTAAQHDQQVIPILFHPVCSEASLISGLKFFWKNYFSAEGAAGCSAGIEAAEQFIASH
jgi:nucleolar MIF4G domain-containing protein 1